MKKELTYETAFKELKEIVKNLEQEDISIDILSEKIKSAIELIHFCREKLLLTDREIEETLKGFQPGK
ncbi:MAG: exodeoxyribonuclease VII small subunit [Bacteroidetes bacterium]|nr:exodeoxyribonuclease VII small subunit [Bacteroidota bacterium]